MPTLRRHRYWQGKTMSRFRTARRVLTGALTIALVAIVLPTVPFTATAHAATKARVIRWVDGDTVLTSRGTVRLIGVDTPERGTCGYTAALLHARRIAPAGSVIRLANPASVQNRDPYGRMLRYVNRARKDVAAVQIRKGARARYDSRDGYDRHPRQARYRGLDARHANYRCAASSSSLVSGPVSPNGWNCPAHAPIKGNMDSMIYHRPGQAYYDATNPEQCFRNGASAEAAGYRAAGI